MTILCGFAVALPCSDPGRRRGVRPMWRANVSEQLRPRCFSHRHSAAGGVGVRLDNEDEENFREGAKAPN
jgi:hypothetical protein